MKRFINIVSLVVLIGCIGLGICLFRPLTIANASLVAFPPNVPHTVDFSLRNEVLEGKSDREVADQLRDWLLYAVVSETGRSSKELSEIFYDVPPIRSGYTNSISNFEYGDTRSKLIGEDQVVALVPAAPVQNRIDQLAHIADEQRKNSGKIPKTFLLYEYEFDVKKLSGQITRRDDIDGQILFSDKYGYFEAQIKNKDDLARFLERIDDIVFAHRDADALRLGGRKIQGYKHFGVGLEHIATIWQSENSLKTKATDASTAVPDGSGFSLDPIYDVKQLQVFFEDVLLPLDYLYGYNDSDDPNLNGFDPYRPSLRPKVSSEDVIAALKKCDSRPFFGWLQDFSNRHPEFQAAFQQKLAKEFPEANEKQYTLDELIAISAEYQRARYDGNLQGTEVGMNLFYTDLLAKLWGFNYKDSIPRDIPDFRSTVEIAESMSPVFYKEWVQLSNSRLWFGPDTRGYQSVDSDQTLVFSRKSIRLFAKSSESSLDLNEVEPNAPTATFINWWDNHYEEVARYEPQYERLNQIMKWSLVITWLNQAGNDEPLGFLKNVSVGHDNIFPQWIYKQPDLRFNKWSSDMFLAKPTGCAPAEELPQLSSALFAVGGGKNKDWTLNGGVSLGSRSAFTGRMGLSVESKVANLARRANVDYAPLKSADDAISLLDGKGFRFQQIAQNRTLISASPKPGATVRSPYGELTPAKFDNVIATETRGLRIQSNYADAKIGELTIQKASNGFRIGWESREIDLANSLGRKLSSASNADEVLASSQFVTGTIKLPGGRGYLAKIGDGESWVKIGLEGKPLSPSEVGWRVHLADSQPFAKPVEIARLDQAQVNAELFGNYVVVRPSQVRTPSIPLEITKDVTGSRSREVSIFINEQQIKAIANAGDDSLLIRYGDLPESLRANPSQLQKAFQSARSTTDGIVRIKVPDIFDGHALTEVLDSRRFVEAAEKLVQSPHDFKLALERNFSTALKESDDLLISRNYQQLDNTLEKLIEIYGPRQELTIRRGLAQIQQGRLTSATKTFNESIAEGMVPNRTLFFNEINQRLSSGGLTPGNTFQFALKGDEVSLKCIVDKIPVGEKVNSLPQLESTILYVENAPRLNNLDWSANVHASLREVISGEFAEVIKLPKGNLSSFRPTEIYVGESARTFRSVQQSVNASKVTFAIPLQGSSRCEAPEQPGTGDCGEVYMVVSRRESRKPN